MPYDSKTTIPQVKAVDGTTRFRKLYPQVSTNIGPLNVATTPLLVLFELDADVTRDDYEQLIDDLEKRAGVRAAHLAVDGAINVEDIPEGTEPWANVALQIQPQAPS